ncbi:iron-enterobactin ABC transporter permease [Brenneria izbisi]|uniref:Iron-enterobactin ABC transporter permease n=1 Tax=Brenneria izbisi TaxID=2939450 RepID=A0AA42C6D7_9GAMM|nr:iron-enterobactin ABC transporter permease [Brenneria izbisi]MCV9880179.1 iron-enterobactin ABC transporter permease [Brenneria izbisi]MCV9883545.1 iron-enterobactin ABC transporter permease [Brenneria izbisi]
MMRHGLTQSALRRRGYCGIMVMLCLMLAVLALISGAMPLSIDLVLRALWGDAPANIVTIVTQWRLPRVVMALILGAALGVSGAIFQSLLRNSLGSPDIIGFNSGAYTGAIMSIILFNGNEFSIAGGALAGGILSSALVWLLTWRQGIQGFRLIIIGIAISALLYAINTWLIISASLESAMSAALWGAGSLNGITWSKALPALLFIAIAFILSLLLTRRMTLMEMGDDTARALGVPVERSRLLLMVIGVALTASATAAAGPISFISLCAPQIARRLSGADIPSLPAAALTGAFLLLAADFLAQRLFSPNQLPVGVVTVCIGGLYLLVLLTRESR